MMHIVFWVSTFNVVPAIMSLYYLSAIARGLVPGSSHNWGVAFAMLGVHLVVGMVCGAILYYGRRKPCSPENETAEQILARYDRRIKLDLANKITGGLR